MPEVTTEKQDVKSFRLTQTTFNKFNEIKEQLGVSQQGTLEALIATYNLCESSAVQPELKTDIEQFSALLNSIQDSFMHLLELNKNAEERAKNSCRSLLDSKDKTIIELQQKLISAEERATAAEAEAEETDAIHTGKMMEQRQEIERLQDALSKRTATLEDREKMLKQCIEIGKLKDEKIKEMAEAMQQATETYKNLHKVSKAVDTLKSQLDEKENQIKNMQIETELQIKTARAETKELYLDKLEASRQEKEQLQNENNELKNRIRELEKKLEAAAVNN